MSKHQTLRNLKAARDLLAQPDGWCKNVLSNGRGAYCALGAINVARNGNAFTWGSLGSPEEIALYAQLPAERKTYSSFASCNESQIAQYNNSTSQQEVVKLFDRAIAKLESELEPQLPPELQIKNLLVNVPVEKEVVRDMDESKV